MAPTGLGGGRKGSHLCSWLAWLGTGKEWQFLGKMHLFGHFLFSYQNNKPNGAGPNSGVISDSFREWNQGRTLWNWILDWKCMKNAFPSMFFLLLLSLQMSHTELTPHSKITFNFNSFSWFRWWRKEIPFPLCPSPDGSVPNWGMERANLRK